MSNENPLVSIVIPTRDEATKYCLDSIQSQTYRDIEVIREVDRYNTGASSTRNRGIRKARGKYIFPCDDDIILEPNCIERMVNVLERNPNESFVYCDYMKAGSLFGIEKAESWNPEVLKKRNYISTMSLVRKEHMPPFDENLKRFNDWDLWLTMAEQGRSGICIHEILFTAYYKPGDISMSNGSDYYKWTTKVREKHNIWNVDHSIIILTLKSTDRIDFENIHDNTFGAYELIIADNLKEGIEKSDSVYISVLYPDTLVTAGWNKKLAETLFHKPQCSAVGPMMAHADSIQNVELMTKYSHLVNAYNVNNAAAGMGFNFKNIVAKNSSFCFSFGRSSYNQIGPFDEGYKTLEGTYQDWIIRGLKMNLRPFINTGVYVHSFGTVKANSKDDLFEDQDLLIKNHGDGLFNFLECQLYQNLAHINKGAL